VNHRAAAILVLLLVVATSCGFGGHKASSRPRVEASAPQRKCTAAAQSRPRQARANPFPGYVVVPPVGPSGLGQAIADLHRAQLCVALPRGVPPQPAGIELDQVPVVSQPSPGTAVRIRSTISLIAGQWQIPSPALGPPHHDPLVVPHLLGLTVHAAEGRAVGFWLAFDGAPPLSARATLRRGLDAYVVATQRPASGAVVPWGGVIVPGGGYRPTVVTVTLRVVL
jgi:hypothetical protein